MKRDRLKFIFFTKMQATLIIDQLTLELHRTDRSEEKPNQWDTKHNLKALRDNFEAGERTFDIDQLSWLKETSMEMLKANKEIQRKADNKDKDHNRVQHLKNQCNKLAIATATPDELLIYKHIV